MKEKKKVNLCKLYKAGRSTIIRAEMKETSVGYRRNRSRLTVTLNIAKRSTAPCWWETGPTK